MNTWLFQADPNVFDVEACLNTHPRQMLWLAAQAADSMRVGDKVFLWRAIGGGDRAFSGVVAEATIEEIPRLRGELPEHLPFWLDLSSNEDRLRGLLSVNRIGLKRRIKYDWLKNDPIFKDAAIFTRKVGTNFKLSDEQALRLNNVWRRANAPWNYADTIAGLWAFWKTRGLQVSSSPGSPAAEAALKTGRVVTKGIANKISNFVSLDPTDSRAGLSNANALDRKVWAEFFDPTKQALDGKSIEIEYQRLWGDSSLPFVSALPEPEDEASNFSDLDLAELMKLWQKKNGHANGQAPGKGGKPRTYRSTTTNFDRDPLVVAIALERANNLCELPGCQHTLFQTSKGKPFLEVHHIEALGEGGGDTPTNVAAICPAHHREAHFGKQSDVIKSSLSSLRTGSS